MGAWQARPALSRIAGIRLQEASCRGRRRIVEFARVYRNRERGPVHHPEFTLIEWYRAHSRYELLMDDCMAVIARAAETIGTRQFTYRDRIADPFAEPDRITMIDAFAQYADIDLREFLTPDLDHRRFASAGIVVAADHGRRHLGRRVQPRADRRLGPILA
jgi:lysyl-tRNA synthetase class 2